MKFKVDENLPIDVADLLRQAEYDATTVLEQALGGELDRQIAVVCQAEGRIIVTLDLDFADIRAYPPRDYAGLIVLRLERQDKIHILEVFKKLLKVLPTEQISNRLWIVDERRIRIRE
jgi:predicted nuclease of predicted toxin-antitoxin system